MAQDEHSSLFHRLKVAKRLPSAPGTALCVLDLCRRENIDIHEIADVLMSDPALSDRLLRFANSPVAGVAREVTSIRDAVYLLGLRAVKFNALGFSLAVSSLEPKCRGFDLGRFWGESFATAVVARKLGPEYFQADREEAFTAGLLAKIGRLAFAHGMPEEYGKLVSDTASGRSLAEKEREVLGMDHVSFGVQLLEDWGIPDLLVQAVSHQHRPDRAEARVVPMARTVHAAARLAPLFCSQAPPSQTEQAEACKVVEKLLKIDERTWKGTAEQILADYVDLAEMFDIQLDGQNSALDLYAEAQEESARVGMVAQLERAQAIAANEDLLRRATTDSLTGSAATA